ncbi:MAG: hypothetical protein HZB56_22305 [Deltaproteobacteria bacterium]|nr:hypothetical protein [Deltaproteobacteria bacterium]
MALVSAFLAVAAVAALRFPEALFRAEFWAEDATEFFFESIATGPRSLVTQVYGYHFLLERAVAWAATALPVHATPFVYAWASLFAGAGSMAYVTRSGFSWIAPHRWQRVLLAALLALAPGTADVLLNLSNLPNPLALLAFLLLVERPAVMRGARITVFALVAMSSGHVLVWLPLAGYLAWRHRSAGHGAAALIIAATAVVNAVGAHAASTAAGSFDLGGLASVPSLFVENAFARLIVAPFTGPSVAGVIQVAPPTAYWPAVALGMLGVGALLLRELRTDREAGVALTLGCAGALGMLGLVALSRSYNLPLLRRGSGSLLPDVRYAFLPACMATLLWARILQGPGPRPLATLRGVAALLVGLQLAAGFPRRHARPDLDWPARARWVALLLDLHRSTGQQVVIRMGDLAIHPRTWVPDNRRVAVVLPSR